MCITVDLKKRCVLDELLSVTKRYDGRVEGAFVIVDEILVPLLEMAVKFGMDSQVVELKAMSGGDLPGVYARDVARRIREGERLP
jgi:hypothetical protein